MIDLSKHSDENEHQFLWRVGALIESGQIQNWRSITPLLNAELREDESDYKDESAYRKPYQAAKAYYRDVFVYMMGNEYANQLRQQKEETYKERVKLQTEKLEYNRWLREDSREELIVEKMLAAAQNLNAISVPAPLPLPQDDDTAEYALLFGDEHYGVEFKIMGLLGEIINEYNPDIFEKRMWELLDKVLAIVDKEKIKVLNVFSMGDFVDGVLRVGQLSKLKYGVVDSTVKYMEFMSVWLNRLSEHVRVKFQMVFGNHSELRFFNQKNGSFQEENMGKVTACYIKAALKNNPNFTYIENPTGLIFAEIAGYNFLGIHGEVKDLEKALKDLSSVYKVNIDYLAGGHLHHAASETIGIDQDVIRVPSIEGSDPFSMSINKTARPGATLLRFKSDDGITLEYKIKLH
ncbi:MAG: hypothetical protein RR365_06240 [Bacteroides sp.]